MSGDAEKKRILIADDHPIIRAGLKQIIDEADDMTVADVCDNCHETLQNIKIAIMTRSCSILRCRMEAGWTFLKQIKSLRPGLPVLILSMHPENQYAMRTSRPAHRVILTRRARNRSFCTPFARSAKAENISIRPWRVNLCRN